MAMRYGKCTNFGNCSIADGGQAAEVPEAANFVCPECGRQLIETSRDMTSGNLMKIGGVLGLVAMIIIAAFYFWPKPLPTPSPPSGTIGHSPPPPQTILKLHGSNTIGAKLAPALVEKLLEREGASSIKRIRKQSPVEMDIQANLAGKDVAVEIAAHGSSTAFKDLLNDTTDIGMASRKIKNGEVTKLQEKGLGTLTSPNGEHVLALDGVAVIVNRSNPIEALSIDEIAKVFSGQVTDWGQVKNGRPGPITIYARDEKSGTYDTFKSLVLEPGNNKLSPGALRFEDSNQLSDKVSSDPNGIGFIGLPYVRSAKALRVSAPGTQALLPSAFTVGREDYLLARRLFLYTPEQPQNPWTLRFVEFALSKPGQDIVNQEGFIALTPESIPPEQSITQVTSTPTPSGNSRPLTTNFRFNTASSDLDNRAIRDLDRVVQVLSQPENRGKRIFLIGHADNRGSESYNRELSKNRAWTISDKLTKRGLNPKLVKVDGLGSKYPIADNNTEEGREKNRRVEVWLDM